jgi:cytochrome c-type biogenesis protein
MLPIYVSYFAGGGERSTAKTLKNAVGFVIGFTTLFVLLGALAGTLGGFLIKYQSVVNIVLGLIIVFFGLNYVGVFKFNIFNGNSGTADIKDLGFFSSFVFGIIFSVGWTPCVGTFLSAALMQASGEGTALSGMLMLLFYSLGLGVPFLISAILIDKLKNAFTFIKKHYKIINIICGAFLIVIGILMMTGTMGKFLALLS